MSRAKYCMDVVRQFDYEGYLGAYVFPRSRRDAYFALRALNVELALVADRVSDPKIAQLRYLWWKNAIDSMKSEQFDSMHDQSPVFAALKPFRHDLSGVLLKRLALCREKIQTKTVFLNLEEIEEYGQSVHSTLLSLQVQLLGGDPFKIDATHEFGEHIGKAIAVAYFIKSIFMQAQHRKCYLPAQTLAEHSLSTQDIFNLIYRQQDSEKYERLKDTVFSMATRANDRLLSARMIQNQVEKHLLPAFSQAIPLQCYLHRLEKFNFDIFNNHMHQRPWYLAFLYLYKLDFKNKVL